MQPFANDGGGGFSLIAALVVIVMVAILAVMLTPVVNGPKVYAHDFECANNLRSLALSSQTYFDARKHYPWPTNKTDGAILKEESESLECLELLYAFDYLEDPRFYVCNGASGIDQAAAPIEDLRERQQTFHLQPNECSYTSRNRLVTSADTPTTPYAADKRRPGALGAPPPHMGGRNVALIGGQVEFFDLDTLADVTKRTTQRFNRELIGFTQAR